MWTIYLARICKCSSRWRLSWAFQSNASYSEDKTVLSFSFDLQQESFSAQSRHAIAKLATRSVVNTTSRTFVLISMAIVCVVHLCDRWFWKGEILSGIELFSELWVKLSLISQYSIMIATLHIEISNIMLFGELSPVWAVSRQNIQLYMDSIRQIIHFSEGRREQIKYINHLRKRHHVQWLDSMLVEESIEKQYTIRQISDKLNFIGVSACLRDKLFQKHSVFQLVASWYTNHQKVQRLIWRYELRL